MCTKDSPRPLIYFGKQPKTAIAFKKFLLKLDIFKGDYQRPVKKVNFIFCFKPSPFSWTNL